MTELSVIHQLMLEQDKALLLLNHVLRTVLTPNILPYKVVEIDAGATRTTMTGNISLDTVNNMIIVMKMEDPMGTKSTRI
jgi:hypothetical protein